MNLVDGEDYFTTQTALATAESLVREDGARFGLRAGKRADIIAVTQLVMLAKLDHAMSRLIGATLGPGDED